jgi:hypothetical protein
MWFGGRGFSGGFRFAFPPFMFHFWPRPFPRREEYLRMLEEYKQSLEAELKEVEKEIEEVRRG